MVCSNSSIKAPFCLSMKLRYKTWLTPIHGNRFLEKVGKILKDGVIPINICDGILSIITWGVPRVCLIFCHTRTTKIPPSKSQHLYTAWIASLPKSWTFSSSCSPVRESLKWERADVLTHDQPVVCWSMKGRSNISKPWIFGKALC